MNKYNAKKTIRKYNGAILAFPSKAEAKYFDRLVVLHRAGKIKGFSTQPQFVLTGAFVIDTDKTKRGMSKVPGLLYTADFRIFENDGRETVVEVKGRHTVDYVMRKKLFLAQAWAEFGVSKFIEVTAGQEICYNCESVRET